MAAVRFDSGDTEGRDERLAFLDLASSIEAVRLYKRRTIDLLMIEPTDRLLDVGCGLGHETLEMGRCATEGETIGIDIDEAMLEAARRRARGSGLPVRFEQADVRQLPFAPESFEGIRIDRVLHFMAMPPDVLREMARVGKPGCRVVVAEPDWNSLDIQGADGAAASAMRAFIADDKYARTGSDVPGWCVDVGLAVSETHPSVVVIEDVETAMQLFQIEGQAARAAAAGVAPPWQLVDWIRSLERAAAAGTFRASLTGYVTLAVKPR